MPAHNFTLSLIASQTELLLEGLGLIGRLVLEQRTGRVVAVHFAALMVDPIDDFIFGKLDCLSKLDGLDHARRIVDASRVLAAVLREGLYPEVLGAFAFRGNADLDRKVRGGRPWRARQRQKVG